MTLDQAIYERLRTDPEIVRLVGTAVYADVLPQRPGPGVENPTTPAPAVTYGRAGDVVHVQSTLGLSGLARTKFRFVAVGGDRLTTRRISDAVLQRFGGFSGTVGDVWLQGCLVTGHRDDWQAPQDAAGNGDYFSAIDIDVWATEPRTQYVVTYG